jgi:hypothetical protein
MTTRLRHILVPIGLLVLVSAQLWVGALWIDADGGIGDGVCCSFTAPVFDILRADGTDQLGYPWSTYRQSMGLLVWPALAAHKFVGANTDFLLWLNLVVVVLTQVILFDLGRRLTNSFGGLIAAGLFPMVPAVAFMARRWDAMVHQHFLLVAGAWFGLRSMGFSRAGSTIGFGVIAAMGSVLSARETDNLLFMAAIGSIAVGVAAQGLFSAQRIRSLLGSLFLAGAMAVFMIQYAFPLVDFAYFQDEMGNREYVEGASRLSWEAITAYPLRMYSDDFTPWLIAPFVLAIVPFLRRGKGRWMLGSWLIFPLAALSMVGKKNFYYAAVVYPVVVLILACGLSVFRPKWLGRVAGIAVLVIGWAQFSSRSLPTSTFPASLARMDWTGEAGPQKHLFQGIVPLHLGPRGPTDHNDAITLIQPKIAQDSCACPNHVLFMGQGDPSDIHLSLAVRDPCISFSNWPNLDHPDSVGWVIAESNGCSQRPPPALMKMGFDLTEAKGEGEHCVALWKRSNKEPRRFCGHRGSPP